MLQPMVRALPTRRPPSMTTHDGGDRPVITIRVFHPDLAHPYQQGRHGAPNRPPDTLTRKQRAAWNHRYHRGKTLGAGIPGLDPTGSNPTATAPGPESPNGTATGQLLGITQQPGPASEH